MTPRLTSVLLVVAGVYAFQRPAGTAASAVSIEDAFATGWMLADTNNDGLADFVNGKIVVPEHPSAAENAAAADLAARIGFATTGLTLPVVVNAAASGGDGPRVWVGRGAVPAALSRSFQTGYGGGLNLSLGVAFGKHSFSCAVTAGASAKIRANP